MAKQKTKSGIRPVRNEADYDRALQEIEPYFLHEPRRGTPQADRFDVLAALIEVYEAKHWPIDPPDPVEAIRYRMEISGLSQADLAQLIGSRSRASEILRRKRPLTMDQAWKLHRDWNIPADVLLRPYHTGSGA
jgi:HTH-type transcriptional regulator / antitoxin HigA